MSTIRATATLLVVTALAVGLAGCSSKVNFHDPEMQDSVCGFWTDMYDAATLRSDIDNAHKKMEVYCL